MIYQIPTKILKQTLALVTILIVVLMSGPTVSARQNTSDQRFTVVIDAGHGGKDIGATGKKAREKDVNLGVALKLRDLIDKYIPDANVVMTRNNDTFVPLQRRADIANEAGGNLFVSIHTNSVANSSKSRSTINGASVYVLGRKSEENLAVAQRENAVIMLEDDYTTAYQGFDPNSPESYIAFELIQNQHMEHSLSAAKAIQDELVSTAGRTDKGVRQAMFWVLVKTGMPAVLIELDFICNPSVERFLSSDAGQVKLAESIFNGIKVYKTSYDREMAQMQGKPLPAPAKNNSDADTQPASHTGKAPKKPAEPSAKTTAKPENNSIVYKVQFLVSKKKLPDNSPKLRGIASPDFYVDGGLYKYTTGSTESAEEARDILRDVKRKYPDAFVIKTRNGKRIK